MEISKLRRLYLDFFVKQCAHSEVPSSPLLPENDPTCLFNTAGMQPLVPFLLGAKHPNGSRITNSQKCLRTDDIDEVGDDTHHTFFEMLGNWSLGDYFKKESVEWSYKFLMGKKEEGCLELDPKRICVTIFKGDDVVPRDEETVKLWQEKGFVLNSEASKDDFQRIYEFGEKENWWKLAETGPCGPDTEIFYYKGDLNDPKFLNHEYYPNDETDMYVEIWNNVFMMYNKDENGNLNELANKNIDTGMGFERILAIVNGVQSAYETPLFAPIIENLKILAGENFNDNSARIIADHIRASVFIMGDQYGVAPSNTDQGYVLRKLLRRAARHMHKMQVDFKECVSIAENFVNLYKDHYVELDTKKDFILNEIKQEIEQFSQTLEKGCRELNKMLSELSEKDISELDGKSTFKLYDTFGFPLEMTMELAKENNFKVDKNGFEDAFKAHQELSRSASKDKFKGGLADNSEESTKLHTATHLLHQALKNVLGDHVNQKGSNITPERLRFDFNHETAVSKEELAEVERIVNEQISRHLSISKQIMTVSEAKSEGAIGLFEDKYGDNVSVYRIGDFSLEICGGPHVENTEKLGTFKIKKEQSCGKGIRRIKAVLI